MKIVSWVVVCLFGMVQAFVSASFAKDFDIRTFGAKADGAKCTVAFKAAFAAAEAEGGGRVVVPAGTWLSGAIRLKSNTELHLADGATVLFSQDPDDYLPPVETSWEGMECWNYSPLVYAYGCTNVAITGTGTLKAFEGEWKKTAWYPWVLQDNGIRAARRQLYDWGAQGVPVAERQIWKKPNAHTRPHLLQLNRCKGIRLEDFKVRNSPFWTIHLYHSEDAVVRGLDVYAHGNNNDGIDIEMTKNVLVENCRFDQGDDGIVIKSGRNQDAWRLARPTENVLVRNCEVVNGHGLLCVGSEISGGVRNIMVENCTAGNVYRVFYVKTNRRRGGVIENVCMKDCKAGCASFAAVCVETDVLYEWAKFPTYEEKLTTIRNLQVDNLMCEKAKYAVYLKGDGDAPIEGVRVNWLDVKAAEVAEPVVENVKGFVYVPKHAPNYDETRIPSYELEDPLTFVDGTKVASVADWPRRRREILEIFAKEMYGAEPPRPEVVNADLLEEKVAAAGFAVRRRHRMTFRKGKTGPSVEWISWVPRHATGDVPVVLLLNYRGAQEFDMDKSVPVPMGWTRNHVKDFLTVGNRVQPTSRGYGLDQNQDTVFPLQMILARGYAVMTACYCDVSPDPDMKESDPSFRQNPFAYTGVFELWEARDPSRTDDISSLGAWAWALSRGLDLAERLPGVDAKKSVVTGYSRLAKAALIAAARDERFTVCVPVQTGGGGCPLAKRDFGENTSTENYYFTHWYCTAYAKYAAAPWKTLTFDQHLFLASIAPRALLVCGFGSKWFDTEGEFLAVKAASPAWTLNGEKGLPEGVWPDDYDTSAIGPRLGYVRRSEGHGISGYDWMWMLDFADGVFNEKK